MEKKNIAILLLSIALVVSSIANIGLSLSATKAPYVPGELITLRAGTYYDLYDIDPVLSWDSVSNDVIEQVCEGLFQYNLSDPDLGIIPMLATDYGMWDISRTKFTIPLRRNVFFHDGTPFNAEAVKWNFERISWFINGTGTLNASVGISPLRYLYEFPNGTTILDPITPVTVNSAYSVTINLRAPYSILEKLLCYVSAFMLSPESTPKYEYISFTNGKIVGTGPFTYDEFDYDSVEPAIYFHRWERYWRTGPFYEELVISYFKDGPTLIKAFIDQSINYLLNGILMALPISGYPEYITAYQGIQGLAYWYLGMNNNKINKTWRQAISYAINYTYILNELREGRAYRSNGPLAPTFSMYNPNIKAANWNLAKARQILVDASITSLTANNDTTGPVADAWKAADFQTWEFLILCGRSLDIEMYLLLHDNLDLIGIEVEEFNYCLTPPIEKDSLELYFNGWGPDYLSPYNMIFPLFSNRSISNYVQYHNHSVEMWFEAVLSETNATKRAELYSKILHQIVEVDMPVAFGYHPYLSCFHNKNINGVPYNAMDKFYAYPIYRDSNS